MREKINKDTIKKAFELASQFESKYWDSELPDYMNLIDDLRLSNNIHETAHSRVLYKLLCCGKCYSYPLLRTFLEIVGIEKDSNDVKLFVEKENIDLLIEIGDKVIILENKVNHAKDQDRQIATYYGKVKRGEIEELKNYQKNNDTDIYVIYLTRNILDDDPNEDSLPKNLRKKLIEEKHYNKISYEKEIRKWIYECRKGWKSELINSVLIQYGNFIENMFEPNKKRNEVMNSIIDKIIWNVNDTEKGDVQKVGIDEKENIINKQLEKVRNAENNLREYKDGLEKYIINEVACELNNHIKEELSKEILCEVDYNKAHIDFCVSYKGKQYRGIACFYRHDKAGLWFGLRTKNKYLVNWDKSQSEIKYDELGGEIEKILKEKLKCEIVDYNYDDNPKINDKLYKGSTEEVDSYAYWKYCNYEKNAIGTMIEEIKEYIRIIVSLKDNSQQ